MSRSLYILVVSVALLVPACAHAQHSLPIEGVRPPRGTVELFTGYSTLRAPTAARRAAVDEYVEPSRARREPRQSRRIASASGSAEGGPASTTISSSVPFQGNGGS